VGEEAGYNVYYDETRNHWLWGEYFDTLEMSKEECIGGENIPREYMYVMPKMEGGKKEVKHVEVKHVEVKHVEVKITNQKII
jgi:hypothetical protein